MVQNAYGRFTWRAFSILWFAFVLILHAVYAQDALTPFYPNGSYNRAVPTPDEVIGFSVGERPVRYDEAIHYFKRLEEESPRVQLVRSGETHEKRTLYYLLITSEENLARLDAIQESISKLADPRTIRYSDEARQIITATPAVVWMMFSIHGDELSGTDASLQLAYQLAAGTDPATEKILRELVVGVDPMENPDGRERYLAQMQQWTSRVPNSDVQGVQHTSVWPWGRTNHYLFDLNRDWFILAHPESRARVKAILKWNPQVVVDAHEMGPYDTYLFNPPREPINPNINRTIHKWWRTFSADQASAFDQYGWSYYTREWNDEWYPGYGSSWPFYTGAVGILYEQASTDGSLVKRPDGTLLTFREGVHHQFISSMANLTTAAENREAMLTDFHKMRKEAISPRKKVDVLAYFIDPGKNPARARRLVERLLMQGIEVDVAEDDFQMKDLRSYWNTKPVTKTLPEGTYVISMAQPLRPLINATLEFDPRMTTAFLQSERESLEKGDGTRMYEVSAWSMLLAYGLDAYMSMSMPSVKTTQIVQLPEFEGEVVNPEPAFGYVVDYRDDRAVNALLRMFELGHKVRVAKKPFQLEGRSFPRGTLILRVNENAATLSDDMKEIAESAHIRIYGVNTALSQQGPDLGGGEFQLLTAPRIALLTGPDINTYNFGALWYLLDYELECNHSILNYTYFDNFDLRKYNVLILPSTWGGPEAFSKIFTKKDLKKLKEWITNGGTIVGIGNAAAFLADSATGISQVRLRRQALKELRLYEEAVEREDNVGQGKIDSVAVWEGKGITRDDQKETQAVGADVKALLEQDKQHRLYMPRGAILRVDLDEEHWLSFGVGLNVPAIVHTSYAFLSKRPVQTAARFSKASQLRLSGLLWPEGRTRWEKTAYATREALGKGQVILFTGEPNFRSYTYGTARMLINSLFLGPGFGTQQVVAW